MSEEPEQQTLTDSEAAADEEKTTQQIILEWYISESLPRTALGFGGKMLIESAIVGLWTVVFIILPGICLAYATQRVSYIQVFGTWMAITTTIVGFTWCFTFATVENNTESED